jgi:hypothetical protein
MILLLLFLITHETIIREKAKLFNEILSLREIPPYPF